MRTSEAFAPISRRALLVQFGSALLVPTAIRAATGKPMRGIFIIMATGYTANKDVDFEDLAAEVDFLERCGVHGMVWPQLASEYYKLTKEERFRGMEVIAKAHRGKQSALVFGVQGPTAKDALEYTRHAEQLEPDALIAIPPTEAKSLDDFLEYYKAIARATKKPIFVQTTGGAKDIEPKVEALASLAREFPNLGHVKEEYEPVISRMIELAKQRPAVKAVFSGGGGRGMMYEMRLGMDGTMPGAPYADVYVKIWDAFQAGQQEKARDIFSKLMLLLNCEQQVPGTRQYIMQKRRVFKTRVSRLRDYELTRAAEAEIDFNWEALKPYLKTA